MTRKSFIWVAAMAVCLCGGAFALPTIKITTPDGNDPPMAELDADPFSRRGITYEYAGMKKFEITGTGSTFLDIKREVAQDSIRIRGNSTAKQVKKPYRIKFDKKVSLFGMEPAKSWVLLANHMDTTFMKNALAFRLAQIVGLEVTNSFQFVNVEICNPSGTCSPRGIYTLTEQVQVNPGRVNIDEKKGWLVEFNFYEPDDNDIFFTTTAERYHLKVFIKSPEIDDKDYKNSDVASYPGLHFIRDELNAILDTLRNPTKFSAGAHRKLIDITSYAQYAFVQQFACNLEWMMGSVGSNFAYKDAGGKMKAGPIWDFDNSAGATNPFEFGRPSTPGIEPQASGSNPIMQQGGPGDDNSFYRRFFEDEVFRARYRKIWDDNKSQIQALAASGGFIDSLANVLKNHVAANSAAYGNKSGASNADQYNQKITNLKSWWNNRHSQWTTQINNDSSRFDAKKDVADAEPETFSLVVAASVGGAVNLSGTTKHESGDSVTITATPDEGYEFVNWTGAGLSGGGSSSTENPLKLGMTRDREITANFAQTTGVKVPSAGGAVRPLMTIKGRMLNIAPPDNSITRIRVIDIKGKTVARFSASGSAKFSLTRIPAGRYFVDVRGKNIKQTMPVVVR